MITKSNRNRNIKRINEKMKNNYNKIQENAEKIRELRQEIRNLSDENEKIYKACIRQELGGFAKDSYKYKYAKVTFEKWINKDDRATFEYESNGEICNKTIEWGKHCYGSGAYINYPLDEDDVDWYERLVEECFDIHKGDDDIDVACPSSYTPGVHKALVDFAITRKSYIHTIIDIYDKYPSNKKIETIKKLRLGGVEYYGIDADWILSQTGIPSKLKVKKIL